MTELNQAAERLRRYSDGATLKSQYGLGQEDSLREMQHDQTVVINAYLEEHTSDDEPITPANIAKHVPADCEWVKRSSGTMAAYWDVGPKLFSLTAYFGGDVLFTARIPDGPRVDWSCKMNVGQLRQLLKALQ